MDRPLHSRYRTWRLVRRIAFAAAALGFAAAVFGLAPRMIQPSLDRSEIRTARVDSGPVEATFSASGVVVPEFEQVMSSPLDARVLRIRKRPGSAVRAGEPILDLDLSESLLAVQKVDQQIAQRANSQDQKRVELETTLNTLRSQRGLKQIDLKSLEIHVDKQKRLREAGLNSEEQLREAQVQAEKARIELRQLDQSIRNAERSTEAQLAGLDLEMATLRKEKAQTEKLVDLGTTKADRDGILTWVVPEIGALVRRGDVVARIADLSSFRVQATVSDVHSARLGPGTPVRVRVTETDYLDGVLTSVLPAIKDGIVTILISLEDKSNRLLRSNLRVDVFIVADRRQRALRLRRGAFAGGEGLHDVFVVRGAKALRTPVEFGISSFDYFEVKSGLLESDEVIVSDIREYGHLEEIRID